ncbi:MAG: protein kinase [Candidatus Krumholzibacteria bacterium]
MIGRTISRYRIVAKIGEGGMGTVWKAEDPLLARTVALKFLPESVSSSADARRRLLREARSASTLNHPGIATVYDAGEADGQIYLAMLFVDGETVADRIRQGPMPLSEATRIGREACEALGHAHSRGVLHRDVTARNIMTTKDGHVVVVDFGLALPEGASRLTRTGVAMGTTAYLAPEVLKGEQSDHRSDIYGLGVVLYEMLTGKLPFEAERQEALSYLAVNEDARPPSEHNPEIDPALDRMVLKALAKDPGERYQTAQEFEAELREFRGEPPRPETDAETAALVSKRGRRRKLVTRISGVLVPRRPVGWLIWAAVLGLVMGILWKTGGLHFGSPHPFASVAVLPLVNDSQSPSESDWVAQAISETLTAKLTQLGIPDLRITPWRTSRRYSDAAVSLGEIADELHVDALIVGSFRVVGGRIQGTISLVEAKRETQYWADEFEESVDDLFAVQRKIATGVAQSLKGKITGEEEVELARPAAESVAALEHYYKGALAMQEETYDADARALIFFEKAIQLDPNLAEAYVGIGAIHSNRFYYGWEGGAKNLEIAEANYRRALESDSKSTNARAGLVRVYWEKGQSEEVLKQGHASVLEGRDDIEALFVRAQAYFMGGQPDKAVVLLERIIERDPANRGAHWFLVMAHNWANQHEKTLETGEEFFTKFGEDGEIHRWVGDSYHHLGDLDAARVHYERALELPGGEVATAHLGHLYDSIGEKEKAREAYAKEIENLRKSLAAYPDNFRMRAGLAAMYGVSGDREKLWQEEMRLLSEPFQGEELFFVAMSHFYVDQPERAFELLKIAAQKGSDNMFAVEGNRIMFGPKGVTISELPGYEQCVAELKKLHDRLRSQY